MTVDGKKDKQNLPKDDGVATDIEISSKSKGPPFNKVLQERER